ncbi:carbohydrate ABC transporter permease [Streptomyces lomondensis]|uniref:ABC transporter permease n=1 Tax=Streptomyces lomondensis TaxID=68229 RepID=A0ABQ2XGL3_9ACTN|nr:carbohydrate ABC transporter permease [Streptomyces lomondensis]MCF0083203.1 carbohydrate ABC transporter permease [Streptomyces lomondensis]GGX15199.1 ABC transporter permease [Streptomyces lomondensis]
MTALSASSARRRLFTPVHAGAVVIALLTALPLYWLAASSFKPDAELGSTPPALWPSHPTLDHYRDAFGQYEFARYLANSLLVASLTTLGVLALGLFSGYALARLPMRGKRPILIALLMISVFPTVSVITPLYLIERQIGWLNSYQGLIVPYIAFHLPFAVWILRNYLLRIPFEMEESARIDGAGPTRTVLQIILPQAGPGLFTSGVFTFTAAYTEFLMALTFNSEDAFRTVPVGVALFGAEFEVPYGTIFAGSIAALLPIVVLVLIFRRAVVSGLTSGAVKG